jgi:predicted ArsR family transcriptional regulator
LILGSDHSTQAAPPTALANLLGRTRACTLGHLTQPTSTTELAQRLEVPPGTASQHLGVLHRAGLVTSARHGHLVPTCAAPSATNY